MYDVFLITTLHVYNTFSRVSPTQGRTFELYSAIVHAISFLNSSLSRISDLFAKLVKQGSAYSAQKRLISYGFLRI